VAITHDEAPCWSAVLAIYKNCSINGKLLGVMSDRPVTRGATSNRRVLLSLAYGGGGNRVSGGGVWPLLVLLLLLLLLQLLLLL